MTEANRQLLWLQGNVLTDDALKSLGLQKAEQTDEVFAVVISHDCDLTAALGKEPIAELMPGRRIEIDSVKIGGRHDDKAFPQGF